MPRQLTADEAALLVTGLEGMVNRLGRVANFLDGSYGWSWRDRAQLVRTSLIALRNDIADRVPGTH